MLNEKLDRVNLGCAFLSFCGVICVARPSFLFGNQHTTSKVDGSTLAIFCALLGAGCQAIVYVSVRKLQKLNFLIVINYFMLTTSVIPLLFLVWGQKVAAETIDMFPLSLIDIKLIFFSNILVL